MADLQLAISEAVVRKLFVTARDNFAFSHSDSVDLGPFTVSYSAGVKLKNGDIDFQSNNTVLLKELDIVYDPLSVTFGLDIPRVCVGGFCIIPTPFGCALRAPRVCFFEDDPDVAATINLSGIITTEISGTCGMTLRFVPEAGAGTPDPWTALANGVSNEWRLHLVPGWLDIDLIDIADTVGNLIDQLIDALVDDVLSPLPGWARGIVKAILHGVTSIIRTILDIGDDIGEWLSNLFNVSLDLFSFVVDEVAKYFADKFALFAFPDPYPMLPAETSVLGPPLVPVLINIVQPAITVTDTELVLETSLGA
ncbi:MAG: hypothetical protein ACJ8BE_16535 [Microvirga sp.]